MIKPHGLTSHDHARMWGDREPLYDFLLPMMSLVDFVILVHAGDN